MGHQQGTLFTWSCHMHYCAAWHSGSLGLQQAALDLSSLLSFHHEGMAGLVSWPCVILRKPSCSFA